jgi:peptidoglycan/LPS O-acetylase OafA/YrhL
MSVEELFYALSPFLFFYITKTGRLINFVLIFYLLGVIITFIFSNLNADGFFSDYQFTFYTTFFGRVFEFACGIYLALIVRNKLNNRFLKKISPHATLIGLILIIILLILQYLTAAYYHVNSAIYTIPGLLLNNICMPAAIIIFFYGLIYYESGIKMLLGSGIMIALGNASYSFYLLHTSFVLNLINKFISNNVLVIFILMILISLFTYRFFEQPVTIYLRKKFSMK